MNKAAITLALVWALISYLAGGTAAAQTVSNYANPNNWMSVPAQADKSIDVFYLYPSAWLPPMGTTETYSSIDDPGMRAVAEEMLTATRGMFEHVANIYAPFYRQTNPNETLGKPLLADVEALISGHEPDMDTQAAFEYYLENYNQGRPFILVSHSQGSSTMKVGILAEMIAKRPELLSRMIAAYSIGWTYTQDYLYQTGLKFAQGPDDTGVIISWNTESEGTTAWNPVVYPGALVINPINWTTSSKYAASGESLGSSIPGYVGSDGYINPVRGVVVNSTLVPDYFSLPGSPFGTGILHGGEWDLYFYDVFQNVITRSLAYYSPSYTARAAELGKGQEADFARYLRLALERNPQPGKLFFHPLHSIFFRLAGQADAASFKAETRALYGALTPQASGQALAALGGISTAASGLFSKQLRLAPAPGQVSASADNPGWSLWARPFYHSGTQKGDALYSELDAEYTGFSMGAVKRTEKLAYAFGFHAGRGDFDASQYDAEAKGLGVGLGITRRFPISETLAPEVSLTGGYSNYNFEQRRKIPGGLSPDGGGVYKSEPRASIWNVGLSAGNDFSVREGVSLRPEIAFDYLSTEMKPYRESGGELALRVKPKRFESLRSSLGLTLNWEATDNVRFSVGGQWHHEFADDNTIMHSSMRNLDAAAFPARGRDLGRDGGAAGLGLEWSPTAFRDTSLALTHIPFLAGDILENASINGSWWSGLEDDADRALYPVFGLDESGPGKTDQQSNGKIQKLGWVATIW